MGTVTTTAAPGSRLWLPFAPRGEYDIRIVFHTIEARMLDGKPLRRFENGKPSEVATTTPAIPSPQAGSRASPRPAATRPVKRKRVLIVIANQDFFYREYADPREELEKAGIDVVVAAGRKAPCQPHGNSGQGRSDGIVQPDVALSDVRVDDYDAILFAGGWGSSAYQYAFNGGYDNPAYNGERAIKEQVNQLITAFLHQKKYTCALCNAVSVLAWARVDGRSPLEGKTVCAPTRQAASGIYDGQRAQPSCRWHPEANGAVVSPAGSIGRPGTAEDDVAVDGLIVTGEDDISARATGRKIVELLSTP
jgi:putative intracellular protease/amidase